MTPAELSETALVDVDLNYRGIDLADGRPILSVVGGGHANPFTREEMAEIARRTIASWNACSGFPTEELEPGMLEKEIIEGSRRIGFLEAQVASMTACLRTCLGVMIDAELQIGMHTPAPAKLLNAMQEASELLKVADELRAKGGAK